MTEDKNKATATGEQVRGLVANHALMHQIGGIPFGEVNSGQ